MIRFRLPAFALLLGCLLMGLVAANAQSKVEMQPSSTFLLNLTIKGLSNQPVYLGYYFADKQYIRDTSKFDAQGNAVFQIEKTPEKGMYLVVLENKKWFEIVVDSAKSLTISTDTSDLPGKLQAADYQNKAFYYYLNTLSQLSKEVETLKTGNNPKKDSLISIKEQAFMGFRDRFLKEHPGSFFGKVLQASREPEVPEPPKASNGRPDSTWQYLYYKNHFWDFTDLTDDGLLRTPVFYPRFERFFDKVIAQIPDTLIVEIERFIQKVSSNKNMFRYVVHTMATKYENAKIMGQDKVLLHLLENYYAKNKAWWVEEADLIKIVDRIRFMKNNQIGMKAVNLVMEDSLGKVHSLYQIQAPYTLVYFWDPGCSHCQKETPKVFEVYEKYKAKGLRTFMVCTERDKEPWLKYIREKKLNWLNVIDVYPRNNFRVDYDVMTTPQLFLLDENKQIIAKKIDAETLEKILDTEFNKKKVNKATSKGKK